jgi:hypothetical protein
MLIVRATYLNIQLVWILPTKRTYGFLIIVEVKSEYCLKEH